MTIALKLTNSQLQKATEGRVASCEMDLQPFSWDKEQADRLRLAMADSGVYPTAQMEGDSDTDQYEENIRVWLPQMLEHLGRTELVAVFRSVSLLVKTPPNEEIFDYIEDKTKKFMAANFPSADLAALAS